LRSVLQAGESSVDQARAHSFQWLKLVGESIPEKDATIRMLEAATTMAEIRGIVRSQVADRLRAKANELGGRAAAEGATLVAICPHPAWDGLIAAARALLLIRRVAALYGLRPGLSVTLTLLRRVAWTAAGTTGISLVSQSLADHALAHLPVLKHVAGALPGTSVVAIRIYRLAGVTAEACSPVPH
jgi:putative membrane protein